MRIKETADHLMYRRRHIRESLKEENIRRNDITILRSQKEKNEELRNT